MTLAEHFSYVILFSRLKCVLKIRFLNCALTGWRWQASYTGVREKSEVLVPLRLSHIVCHYGIVKMLIRVICEALGACFHQHTVSILHGSNSCVIFVTRKSHLFHGCHERIPAICALFR